MSIFSWLFSKDTESKSHVRKWVIQEIDSVDTANPDIYAIFVGLIHTAIQCGKYSIEEKNDKFVEVSRQYLGDATIFEIACYTYHRLENWLAKNQPELQSEIALPISKWIIEKFSLTFYLDQHRVSQLFAEQLERYQTMTKEGKNLGEIHGELEKQILMTKGDKFDQKHLPKDLSSLAIDSQYIKLSLANYEEIYIPAVIAGIQEYCSKKTIKQKIQNQNQLQNQEQKDYLYGMALLAQEDWVRACKAFTKVISANPKHYKALVQRGLLYVTLHQPIDAMQDFTMAIEVNPNEPAPYLHRGKCYHRNFRQKDKSLADYSTAIRLAPMDAAGYFGRGELYDEIALCDERQALENNDQAKYAHVPEDLLAAINDYSQVVALEPEHDGAYTKRGLVYARKARANKDIDFIVKAIADFERAMNLNWENGYLYKQQDEMKELLEQATQSEGKATIETPTLDPSFPLDF